MSINNWQEIGNKIWEFISTIDWAGIVNKMAEAFGSACGALAGLLWGFIKNAWANVVNWWQDNAMEDGKFTFEGLLNGILKGVKNIAKWIKDNIFMPFINGFKKAFGINSPSKEMGTMGNFIIDGLFNAISSGISKIKKIFEKMLEKIQDVFSDIGDWFKEKFENAWDNIANVFGGIGDWFSSRWTDITNALGSVGTWFKEMFQTAWNNVTNIFSGVGKWFGGIWSNIKEAFSSVGTWFKEIFQTAWDNVTGIFGGIAEWFGEIWDGVVNAIKTPINGMISLINGLLSGIEDGLNWLIGGFNKISVDIPSWVPGIGGKSFGINISSVDIPQIPHLATGGLATAPTLAMVGDNKNASVDPEVIAPLSKLKGMMGDNSEVLELLKIIVELLRNGSNIELINYLFPNAPAFKREVLKVFTEEQVRRGGF